MQSERTQTDKSTHYMIPLISHSRTGKTVVIAAQWFPNGH